MAGACCAGRYRWRDYAVGIGLRIMFDGVHLATNGPAEGLHEFARLIGLRREWYQVHARHPHYDVTGARAARLPVNCTPRELVRVCWRGER